MSTSWTVLYTIKAIGIGCRVYGTLVLAFTPSTITGMNPTIKWVAVSVVTLAVVETTLTKAGQPFYTHIYRQARQHPKLKYLPVAAAALTFAHLEGWLPETCDPYLLCFNSLKAVSKRIR